MASSLGLVVYLRFMKVCRGFITVSAGFGTVHRGFGRRFTKGCRRFMQDDDQADP